MLRCGSKQMQHSVSTTVEKTSKSIGRFTRDTGIIGAWNGSTTLVEGVGISLSGEIRTDDRDEMTLVIRATRFRGRFDCELPDIEESTLLSGGVGGRGAGRFDMLRMSLR
jgi:hypothetical protein